MKKLLLLLVFVSLSSVNAQVYRQVEIFIDRPTDISRLFDAGMDFDHPMMTKHNSFIAVLSQKDFDILQTTSYEYHVLIDDLQKYYESLPKLSDAEKESFIRQSGIQYNVTGIGYGSMGGYYTMSEVWQQLDSMYARFPNLITQKFSIGTSIEGRPIYAVKISDNPNVSENEPRILYTGLHHAREPQGMTCDLYFMYYLLENYGTNPEATYLVNNRELYFVPILNVDGYEYNHTTYPNGNGMWRKNRRNNGGSYGVDLNRNYGPYVYWNSSNGGSSTYPSDDTYRGTAPFSEPETAALRDFIAGKNIKCALNYHAHGQYLIHPYGSLSRETPDSLIFREFSTDMTAYNGYFAGRDIEAVGYATRGGSDDYMYDGDILLNGSKIFSMTPEVGTAFWPTQAEIFPIAQENLRPNIYYAWVAGDFVSLLSPNFDRQYFSPGDVVNMQPIFKNKGLSDASNLSFVLSSLTPGVTITNGTASLDLLLARTQDTVSQVMTFQIGNSVPVETRVKLLVTKSINGSAVANDTISLMVGYPSFVFMDTSNVISTYWTVTGTPTTAPVWETTTTAFHSAPNCYTDSRLGNYVSNATIDLTSANAINLGGISSPRLTFWMKHVFETQYDCGVVLVSTNNGSSWTAVQGLYSIPASGSGKQVPAGMPVYDGTRSSWVREEFDLSAFGGQQVKLKFSLRSDGSLNYDGWYLDDIGIFYYGVVPVELTSFNASVTDNKILLSWKTATETNNKGFQVERAAATAPASEIKDWQNIAFINGRGTTTEPSDYSFTDGNPLTGKVYYRLKQVDLDGSFTYSNPVEVTYSGVRDFALSQNYPNPFNPSTKITFSIPSQEYVSLKIYDVLGSEAAVIINEVKEPGTYSVDIILQKLNLGSGVYFYTIKAGSFNQTRKMVVLK